LVAHAPAGLQVDLQLDDEHIGRLRLPLGWSNSRIALPSSKGTFVERLTIFWSEPDDPDIGPAFVEEIRFEHSAAADR
jgi:hypothetical protein